MTDQNQPPTGPTILLMTEVYDQKPPKTSGLAITALILGIVGFVTCGITSLFGLILGIVSLIQVNRNKETLSGQGYAVAGIVTGAISMFMMPILAAILFPIFAMGRESARSITCLANVNKISQSMMMYSNDNNDSFPVSSNWTEAISPYLPDKKQLICPSARSEKTGYAMNKKLSKTNINKIPSPTDTIMIFDSYPGDNQNGGIELLPSPARHMIARSRYDQDNYQRIGRAGSRRIDTGINNIGFADGHARSLTVELTESLIWDPAKQ